MAIDRLDSTNLPPGKATGESTPARSLTSRLPSLTGLRSRLRCWCPGPALSDRVVWWHHHRRTKAGDWRTLVGERPRPGVEERRDAVDQPAEGDSDEVMLLGLCTMVLSSLPRSDQRDKGVQYVRGLLSAEGRKSIRNIATVVGGQAAEQSLRHFIAGSTWDWGPVRRTLVEHLARIAPPQAWVLRPMVVPKALHRARGGDAEPERGRGRAAPGVRPGRVGAAAGGAPQPAAGR